MLISEEYRAEQAKLHENENYGIASVQWAPLVTQTINGTGALELLDYGAGKGRLALSIRPDHDISVFHYEPSNPEWADTPEPREMVCCIDVLEHIEPDCLDAVLDDLQRVTQKVGFFTIHTGPARKVLSDGRNAHLTQQPPSWWMPKLFERFDVQAMIKVPHGFYVIVWPLQTTQN